MATLLTAREPTVMSHITQAKRALQALLQEQLPAWLSRGDALANDGVTSDPPAGIYLADREALAISPALELVVTSSTPAPDSSAQLMEPRLAIGFTLAGSDISVLAVQAERYMWALRHVCRDTLLAPDCPTGPIETGAEQYTPLDRNAGNVESPF